MESETAPAVRLAFHVLPATSVNRGVATPNIRRPLRLGAGSNDDALPTAAGDDGQLDNGQPVRVLIVEDEALVVLDMTMILTAEGFTVMDTKPTGESALYALAAAAAAQTLPDVVLLDIALRGNIDGIETARQIKARYPAVPVAFVTGQADSLTRARAETMKPAGYLLKPFTPEQLVTFLRTVTNSR